MGRQEKYLFTGTFDSGKTTAINSYRSVSGIEVVGEVARDLLYLQPPLATRPEFHDINFTEQKRRELVVESTGKPIILLDRGVLDIVVYAKVLDNPDKQEWIDALEGRYQYICIFNKDDIQLPDLSDETVQFRNAVDMEIRNLAPILDIPIFEIEGDPSTRKERLQKIIYEKE